MTARRQAMEFFYYAGSRIFDPHAPVSELVVFHASKEDQRR